MSADNWTICPDCQKRVKGMKEAFVKKYYGELDAFVYGQMLDEVSKAVEHMASYSSDEHKPDEKILALMEERDISVKWSGHDYDAGEILCQCCISCCLREDYEQGVNDDGCIYFYYTCSCDCGFGDDVKYEASKHKIVEKTDGTKQ